MRRLPLLLVVLLAFCLCAVGAHAAKNVIIMIGDGMGPEHVKAGSYYLTGAAGNLSFEPYYKCTVTTHSLNNPVTDSAAAATAMATGYKTNNNIISQSPTGTPYTTILEMAKGMGKRAGLVTVDPITHATPAGFGAHEPSRSNYINIGNDYLNSSQPDVIFGGADPARGGSSYFSAAQVTTAQGLGYQVVYDNAQMQAIDPNTTSRALGLFAGSTLTREHDRLPGNAEPHLSQMTAKALAMLEQDPDGFFLMVEAGNNDHSAHDRNIADVTFEMVEFHNTVQQVLNWMQGRSDTLLIVTGDHETGGLTAANNGAGVIPGASWTTTGHTATNVPLYTAGAGSSFFDQYITGGVCDNTDVFKVMNQAFIPEPCTTAVLLAGLGCLVARGLGRKR